MTTHDFVLHNYYSKVRDVARSVQQEAGDMLFDGRVTPTEAIEVIDRSTAKLRLKLEYLYDLRDGIAVHGNVKEDGDSV